LQDDRIKHSEQHSFWKQVQIPNKIWIKIPGSKTAFEFELNLLGVQTCLEKSDKFSEILICLGLPEWAWSFGAGWSTICLQTCGLQLGVQKEA
jgi:hypothetical protein